MSTARPKHDASPYENELSAAQAIGGNHMTAAPYLVPPEAPAGVALDMEIALVGPDVHRRNEAVFTLFQCAGQMPRQFGSYPDELEDLPRLLDENHDVVLVDLDSDPEYALALVEKICVHGHSTVMVYSSQSDPQLLVRCMRAGAREFLALPFNHAIVTQALERAAQRRPAPVAHPAKTGKLLVFMGSKGGVGVTSVACNFAVALAQDVAQKTLLIDLDLPLGDAALNLGIVAEFSTVNALQEADRLDGAFLSQLLVKHSSGLSVLAAPGKFPNYEAGSQAIDKLVDAACQEFDNVVVDVGSRLNVQETALFDRASAIYLVTQAGIPELRNSNRLISQVFANGGPRLEIVLNRFESRTLGVSEEHITKALTRPAQWKVPNDHALVRKMQIDGSPLVLGDSTVARTIRRMAESVNPKQPAAAKPQPKKKGFSLFS